jgi:tetratricopeptide (TPR) repeat protein
MKRVTELTAILGIMALFFLNSCQSTTQLQVLQPAQFKIPDHIEVIATVDRSKPGKGAGSFFEGLLTGEEIGQDKNGRRRAFDGLSNTLTQTPRFQVRHTGIVLPGSKKVNRFGRPLDWSEVERICRQYNADALAVIEKFDSDNFRSVKEKTRKKKDKEGNEYIETYFESKMKMDLNIGFRLYDPKKRVILDEFTVRRHADASGRGKTEEIAMNDLPSPRYVSEDLGYQTGMDYAMRIAPTWVMVVRDFYKKGKRETKKQMKTAAKYAENGNWEKASKMWEEILENEPDKKTAGRIAYNLAVAAERLDRLDLALSWAEKAQFDFGNKKARSYTELLNRRLNDVRLVDYQMPKRP